MVEKKPSHHEIAKKHLKKAQHHMEKAHKQLKDKVKKKK